ncbi:hypothetical protein Taro_038702 [Colocasia esculenta]|uniref:Ribosomal protein L34e superfamily protein n=1 Tax=Colocasia esculenta TaxID=4460 RepID=A0A843WEM1_COLES|nr:hypothetical protein [Colocasia esculenta]
MVDSRFLITFTKPSDRRRRSTSPPMADAAAPSAPAGNQLAQQSQRSRKKSVTANTAKSSPPCHWSHGAAADVVILVAVLFAFGFLLLPYLQLFYHGLAGVGEAVLSELREESIGMVWLFAVLCFFLLTVGVFVGFLCSTSDRKCSNPNCRGLRNAAEFDIVIETEERMKNSSCPDGKDGSGRLFFELNEGHHKELEAELKKMAPPRGRAILLFQEKCGCSVGRLVVYGPKKIRKSLRYHCSSILMLLFCIDTLFELYFFVPSRRDAVPPFLEECLWKWKISQFIKSILSCCSCSHECMRIANPSLVEYYTSNGDVR